MRKLAGILTLMVATIMPLATIGGAEELKVCPPGNWLGKVDTPNGPETVTVQAPDGYLISWYCVKAGSVQQGNGPVIVGLEPPVKTVTFGHPSGKDISHYSVGLEEDPWSSTTTSTSSPSTTVTLPSSTTTSSPATTSTTSTSSTTTSNPSSSSTSTPEDPSTTTTPAPPTAPSTPPPTLPYTGLGEEGKAALVAAGMLLLGTLLIAGGREEIQ